MNIKAEKESKADLVKRLNDLSDVVERENRSFTEQETEQFDVLHRQIAELTERIETAERVERARAIKAPAVHVASHSQPASSKEDSDLVFRAWALRKSGDSKSISREMRNAVERMDFDIDSPSFIFRDQTAGTAGEGGNTVNGEVVQTIVEKQKAFGGLQSICGNLNTADGSPLRFPKNDNTSSSGAWIDELDSVDNVSLTFDKVVLNSYTLSSGVFPVSNQLLRDTRINLNQFVFGALGTRLGRALATAIVSGDGSGKPTGLIAASGGVSTGKTTADDVTFTPAELQELIHSVDPAYRNGAVLLMHDTTWQYMKTWVDGENRPIYSQSYAGASPMTFDGYPIVIDNAMPTIAASKKIITFGRHSDYLLRSVNSVEVRVSNEKYVDQYATAFYAFGNFDGKYIGYDSVKCMLTNT